MNNTNSIYPEDLEGKGVDINTGKCVVSVYGFINSAEYSLSDLSGYTVKVTAFNKNGEILDSNSHVVDDIVVDGNRLKFERLTVSNESEVDKVVVIVKNNWFISVQTIEKQL